MTQDGCLPRVSIVIPTYNQANFLAECLRSVRSQTITNWECIVINNYSDDDTVEIAQYFQDERIKIENFRNNGVIAASRNRGIILAKAPWIAFLDSDDVWLPSKLERCLAEAGPDIDLVSHAEAITRNERPAGLKVAGDARRLIYKNLLFGENPLSPSALLVRRELLLELDGFAEEPAIITAEDYDLWLRLARRGIRPAFVDEPLSKYRLHGGNATASVLRHMNATLAVLDRHAELLGRLSLTDRARLRRKRALVRYAAGRSQQAMGQPFQALFHFARSLAAWPLIWKPYAAMAISLLRLVIRPHII